MEETIIAQIDREGETVGLMSVEVMHFQGRRISKKSAAGQA
ncbi:MAG: hypothetical protein ACLTQG_30650 [Hungatella sp.]